MTLAVTHAKVSSGTTNNNVEVDLADWNDSHTLTGKVGLAQGGTEADLSATGGTGQVLKQATAGAVVTVGTVAASEIASGAALTKTDDTNVTLTLGGTPTTALLTATSVTVGWSGTLAVSRGGTGLSSITANNLIIGNGTSAATLLAPGTAGLPLVSNGAGVNPSYSTLPVSGGGSGANSQTAYAVLCGGTTGTAAFQSIASVGTSGHVLTSNGAGTLPTFQAAASGGVPTPQGRLTLQTAVPVMITSQSAKTTIYYTPYQGNQIPIYNGSSMTSTTFTELSVATTDTTKSPAAIGASKVNDWFVWNDSGTIRIGHGPDWTNDTTRSAGTALVMVNGILLNNATITNGPAASRGTYVGTTRSNASSQLDWTLGTSAAGGGAAFLNVWNAYNRVSVTTYVNNSTTSYTYASTTVRSANASDGNRVSFVMGLAEDGIVATFGLLVTTAASAGSAFAVGPSLDSTTVIDRRSLVTTSAAFAAFASAITTHTWGPQLGYHFIQGTEAGDGTTCTLNANITYGGLEFSTHM